jgi:hypothetical protein
MSEHYGISKRRSATQPMAVSVTVDGVTTVYVHGPDGPETMVTLRGPGGIEKVIPSATIVNVHPDDQCVAWNGEQFVMCEGIVDIIEANNLEYVAKVIPVNLLEFMTGIKPSPLYIQGPSEVERRRQLLDEYKAATGNPSNKQIYEAENSSIYKPQFYEWRDGRLPASSATTFNFERFLHEKKRPIKGGR